MIDATKKKTKLLHVNQDFFQQIVSGFSSEKNFERQSAIILSSPQQTFFTKKTLPIILKQQQKQGLLKNFFQAYYQKFVKEKENSLKKQFMGILSNIVIRKSVVQEQIQQQPKKGLGITKVRKLMKMYNNVHRAIAVMRFYKGVKRDYGETISQYGRYVENPTQLEKQLEMMIWDTQDPLIQAMKKVTFPVYYKFNKAIEDKLDCDIAYFWWWVVKTIFLPDWSDPVDVAIWLVSVAAGIFSYGAGFLAGISVRVGGLVGKLIKLCASILRILDKFWDTSKIISSVNKFRGIWQVGSKMTFAIKASSMLSYTQNIYGALKIGKTLFTGIDLYYTDEDDVQQMHSKYKVMSDEWRGKTMRSLNNNLKGIGQDLQFIDESLKKLQNDSRQAIVFMMGTGGFIRLLEKRYNTALKLHVKIQKNEKHWINQFYKTCEKICKFFTTNNKLSDKLVIDKEGVHIKRRTSHMQNVLDNKIKFDVEEDPSIKHAISDIKLQKTSQGVQMIGLDRGVLGNQKKYRLTKNGDFYINGQQKIKGATQEDIKAKFGRWTEYSNIYSHESWVEMPYRIYVHNVQRISGAVTTIPLTMTGGKWLEVFSQAKHRRFYFNGVNVDDLKVYTLQHSFSNFRDDILYLDLKWLYYYESANPIRVDGKYIEGELWEIMSRISQKEKQYLEQEKVFRNTLKQLDKIIQIKIDEFQQVKAENQKKK